MLVVVLSVSTCKSGFLFPTDHLPVRIDGKATTRPDLDAGATGMVAAQTQPQTVVQGTTVVPDSSHQPNAWSTTGFGDENIHIPSEKEILRLIAYKCFQQVDAANQEQKNEFIEYMEKVRKVILVDAKEGSLIITVKCNSLQILDELWEDYCSGHLNEVAQKFLVTKDILETFGLIEMKLSTTIVEEEYKACREYIQNRPGI